jgi:hypothetical protein
MLLDLVLLLILIARLLLLMTLEKNFKLLKKILLMLRLDLLHLMHKLPLFQPKLLLFKKI